jgi:hypothetical protein
MHSQAYFKARGLAWQLERFEWRLGRPLPIGQGLGFE